jgi:hypothetical protein
MRICNAVARLRFNIERKQGAGIEAAECAGRPREEDPFAPSTRTQTRKVMKKTLIVLCAAIALVGCDRNRGGASNSSNRDTGYGTSRDNSSSRSMNRDNSSLNPSSSSISTNTNNAVGAPGTSGTGTSGQNGSGTTP